MDALRWQQILNAYPDAAAREWLEKAVIDMREELKDVYNRILDLEDSLRRLEKQE